MRPMHDLRAGPGASNVRWVFNEDDESDDGTQSLSPGSPCSMATTDTTCAVPSPLLSPNLPFRAAASAPHRGPSHSLAVTSSAGSPARLPDTLGFPQSRHRGSHPNPLHHHQRWAPDSLQSPDQLSSNTLSPLSPLSPAASLVGGSTLLRSQPRRATGGKAADAFSAGKGPPGARAWEGGSGGRAGGKSRGGRPAAKGLPPNPMDGGGGGQFQQQQQHHGHHHLAGLGGPAGDEDLYPSSPSSGTLPEPRYHQPRRGGRNSVPYTAQATSPLSMPMPSGLRYHPNRAHPIPTPSSQAPQATPLAPRGVGSHGLLSSPIILPSMDPSQLLKDGDRADETLDGVALENHLPQAEVVPQTRQKEVMQTRDKTATVLVSVRFARGDLDVSTKMPIGMWLTAEALKAQLCARLSARYSIAIDPNKHTLQLVEPGISSIEGYLHGGVALPLYTHLRKKWGLDPPDTPPPAAAAAPPPAAVEDAPEKAPDAPEKTEHPEKTEQPAETPPANGDGKGAAPPADEPKPAEDGAGEGGADAPGGEGGDEKEQPVGDEKGEATETGEEDAAAAAAGGGGEGAEGGEKAGEVQPEIDSVVKPAAVDPPPPPAMVVTPGDEVVTIEVVPLFSILEILPNLTGLPRVFDHDTFTVHSSRGKSYRLKRKLPAGTDGGASTTTTTSFTLDTQGECVNFTHAHVHVHILEGGQLATTFSSNAVTLPLQDVMKSMRTAAAPLLNTFLNLQHVSATASSSCGPTGTSDYHLHTHPTLASQHGSAQKKKYEDDRFGLASRQLRSLVSKKKKRFQDNGYDLDLTYITDRIIAMGFPSAGKEAIYRNRMESVEAFFSERHPHAYKIYNLCEERTYDLSKFGGSVARYPFVDHCPPVFNQILLFCQDVDQYLCEDADRVVSIHCKAGKGRTGTMICAYLLYSGQFATSNEALRFYGKQRTSDGKGVTIPSQIRYVHYFGRLMRDHGRVMIPDRPLVLVMLRLYTTPHFADGGCDPYFLVHSNLTQEKLYDSKDETGVRHIVGQKVTDMRLARKVVCHGDIRIQMFHQDKMDRKGSKMFQFFFHTFFVTDQYVLHLGKAELDKSKKDKDNKYFDHSLAVDCIFREPLPGEDM
ncbi:Phosphatidylinositol 3 [Diplonema papillatum]|nr:Phosphatidylinositol 3 [Diplonema papillatum]